MQKRVCIYVPMGVTETDCRAWVLLVLSEFCFSLLTTVFANLVYSFPPHVNFYTYIILLNRHI